jgi:hypothetical protein
MYAFIITPLNQPITIDESAEATLLRAAHKELAYLEQFDQPLLPFQHVRKEVYQYEEQSPSDHIKDLDRDLLIASSLPPSAISPIPHPELQKNNIIVSKSPDSNWQVVGLLDWLHASILLPVFLGSVPERLQNYDDPISQSMAPPSLLENLDNSDEPERTRAKELYFQRLVHYHS